MPNTIFSNSTLSLIICMYIFMYTNIEKLDVYNLVKASEKKSMV